VETVYRTSYAKAYGARWTVWPLARSSPIVDSRLVGHALDSWGQACRSQTTFAWLRASVLPPGRGDEARSLLTPERVASKLFARRKSREFGNQVGATRWCRWAGGAKQLTRHWFGRQQIPGSIRFWIDWVGLGDGGSHAAPATREIASGREGEVETKRGSVTFPRLQRGSV